MLESIPLFFALATSTCSGVLTGADRLYENPYRQWLEGKNVGLITNHTGVNCQLKPTATLIEALPGTKLIALFSPEHGIDGSSQSGKPVSSQGITHSLYGAIQAPTPEMLNRIEVLVFDIQDVGARFYTYISTLLKSMQAAAKKGIPFIVLDRPNPITGKHVEGPVLEEKFKSFVGSFKIPIRYGLTSGELATLANFELKLQCQLKVVPMKGWKRNFWYDDTHLNWIATSPNMPTLETATLYPGFCLIEGTNLSEGRGTTRPFELVGAPWINNKKLVKVLNNLNLPGVIFRMQNFSPWFSKYKGETCHGIQIHLIDRSTFRPIEVLLNFLSEVIRLHSDKFIFQPSFDLLIGNNWVQKKLKKGFSASKIRSEWQKDLQNFKSLRRQFFLYSDDDRKNQP